MMDINRNQFLMAGLVILALGAQFRAVESYVLTQDFTRLLAKQTGQPLAAVNAPAQSVAQSDQPLPGKRVPVPDWLGWSLLSIGAVLILHSLGMKRPG